MYLHFFFNLKIARMNILYKFKKFRLYFFLDHFLVGSGLCYLEVLKDSRNFRIRFEWVTELGVRPYISGGLGLFVIGANILTISVCPLSAAP